MRAKLSEIKYIFLSSSQKQQISKNTIRIVIFIIILNISIICYMSSKLDKIEDIANEFWNGQNSTERQDQPLAFFSADLYQLQKDIAFQMSFGNCSVVKTTAGLVIIDAGILVVGSILYKRIKKYFPSIPIVACIYTHGHIDHVQGLIKVQELQYLDGGQKITVYGHRNVTGRFDRYCRTCGYNQLINNRQFDQKVDLRSKIEKFIHPDVVYDSTLEITIGQTRFILNHDKGETDDATWIYLPQHGTVFVGDLFIWNSPNCGNPQKVQRYPLQWANALFKIAKLKPSLLIPGHGPHIRGNDRINQALTDTGNFLHNICNQTLELINKGLSLNTILYSVQIDKNLIKKEYLKPYYDDPEFIIRNIWRQYAGWWNFELPDLKPEKKDKIAKQISNIYRSLQHQIEHIDSLMKKNQLKLALFFIQIAYSNFPDNRRVISLRIDILSRIAQKESSLMARNIYNYGIKEAKAKL